MRSLHRMHHWNRVTERERAGCKRPASEAGPAALSVRSISDAWRDVALGAGQPRQILDLQQAVGNRAVGDLLARRRRGDGLRRLARRPARDMLIGLRSMAANRWHDDMQEMIDELVAAYGHINIGDYQLEAMGTAYVLTPVRRLTLAIQFGWKVGEAIKRSDFSATPQFKLVNYLLTGGGNAPGWGSLGKLKIAGDAGDELVERPGFSSRTLKAVPILPHHARRHITAWHNIRHFLNKLMKRDRAAWITKIKELSKSGDPEMLEEVADLLKGKPLSAFGSFGAADGGALLTAAYLMNSRVRNLWSGPSLENSEIATFSSNVRKYIGSWMFFPARIGELRKRINDYAVVHEQAREAKVQLLGVIDDWSGGTRSRLSQAQLASELTRALEWLEFDRPQYAPHGGALSKREKQVHENMFRFTVLEEDLMDHELEAILTYFLSATDVPS